jgi:hypothetical protein
LHSDQPAAERVAATRPIQPATANPGRQGGPETILGHEELQLPPRGDRAGAPQAAALPKPLVILAVSSRRPPYADRAKKLGRPLKTILADL